MTLGAAREAFNRDLRTRRLAPATIRSYNAALRLLEAALPRGSRTELGEIDDAALRAAREGWTCKPTTHALRLRLLRTFFRFAVAAGWLSRSPATALKAPRQDPPPTLPLSIDEMRRLLAAARPQPDEFALLLLMRYSGLAIQDAVTLRRSDLIGDALTLRRAKTGELVETVLPDVVVAALESVARPGSHFFWTGHSTPVTVAKIWRERLNRVAQQAGVRNFRPHRLRDTFAVEMLAFGVSMQDVSTLLGHTSIRTTERYYAPWNKSRRDRLTRIVRETQDRDALLGTIGEHHDHRRSEGAAGTAPAEAGLANTQRSQATRAAYE